MASQRRPQYRVLDRLLRQVTAELLIKGLDENGIRLRGVERRRDRLIKKVLIVIGRLNQHEHAKKLKRCMIGPPLNLRP